MAAKKTGISRDLVIHPGETIADVLEQRNITQLELATRTGMSPAYVNNVISGKKDISAKFAMHLEYALSIPKSFWLNLQANYDAEMLEIGEKETITTNEREILSHLKDIVKLLKIRGAIKPRASIEETILELRKELQISNIVNLKQLVPSGAFRMASTSTVDEYVLGAWLRLCQVSTEDHNIETEFNIKSIDSLVFDLKQIMLNHDCNLPSELSMTMKRYGIDFSLVRNFKGAPVHGYICRRKDDSYQMVVTIRGAYADIFWFTLFHELGHIVNGDISKTTKFIDLIDNDTVDEDRELKADCFARNTLLNPNDYDKFIQERDFSIRAIKKFAASQNVMPYIVIGRLQKEKLVQYSWYSDYKLRYKWKQEL